MSSKQTTGQYYELNKCSFLDQRRLKSKISRLNASLKGLDQDARQGKIKALESAIAEAQARLEARLNRPVRVQYPESLPVSGRIEDIRAALDTHQVVIVAGETGSGKTTQLPKVCLEHGLGRRGMIGHTQPRRLAARTVSARIAEELNVELGDLVGYQVRFTDQVSERSFVKVMTDGILLSEIKHDRDLLRYEAIIVDEAHERSLNIDFLLGYLKQLLPRRPELKVIITSATIDVDRFAKHFGDAPVISVSGRTFPVELCYRSPFSGDQELATLPEQVLGVIEEIEQSERERGWGIGDVLVFLPGEREIREVSQYLRHQNLPHTEISPLYARLSSAEQNRIFRSHPGRRIVLSTNVAETSITVPGIRYVIDSGLVRMSRYSVRSKIQRLPIEAVSQASANQRMGRCGRVAEGICYRLYSEEDFQSRPEFTDPEILRTNLASVILKMKDAGLGDVQAFPFVEPPDKKLWNDGYKLLFELGAVDRQHKLSKAGKQLAMFPIDPRLAKMLLSAAENKVLREMLVIVSALSIQDPRERPADKKQAADQAHAEFRDDESDFVSLLNLWNAYEAQRQILSGNQLKKYCQKKFISHLRMREWRDLHRQLKLLAKSLPGDHDTPASYEALHRSILSGFLGQIGHFEEKREYRGCRNRKFQIFPGSALLKKKPKWLVSAEIVETAQIYARMNARIDPQWIEPLAPHLVKLSWSEPHWQKKRGQVLAYEKVSLYGLEIVSRRLVNFARIEPVQAREIFIRAALVEGGYQPKSDIIRRNQALIQELETLEDRTRRRDIVIDDERIYALYDACLPAHVVSAASLEKWLKSLDQAEREKLVFNREQLAQEALDHFDPSLYPDTLENNGIRLPLRYHFDPASSQDGVTVSVPLRAARQISGHRLERLVPGLLKEKCTALVKNLPRSLRKNFVPVPDVINAIYPRIETSEEPLLEALTKALKIHSGIEVPYEAWDPELLDKHLRMHIEVLDDHGRVLEEGRDIAGIVEKVEHLIDQAPALQKEQVAVEDDARYTEWHFGDLAPEMEVQQAGIGMRVFPALEDYGNGVGIVQCNDAHRAARLHRLGLARLLSFRLQTQIRSFDKLFPQYKKMGLLYAPIGQAKVLYDDFMLFTLAEHFVTSRPIRNASAFEQCYQEGRADYVEQAGQLCQLVYDILTQYHQLMKMLKGKMNLAVALPMADLQAQLEQLVHPGFLKSLPLSRLQHYPRYLEACVVRLEKMPREMAREREFVPKLKQWWQQYEGRRVQFERQGMWSEDLEHFRWLIEEQRVSWYAQQLGTDETVSEKRLNKVWESLPRV